MFKPVKIDKCFYVDGGVMNNLPVESLREKVDFAIGYAFAKELIKEQIKKMIDNYTNV
jgi:NTE family protein